MIKTAKRAIEEKSVEINLGYFKRGDDLCHCVYYVTKEQGLPNYEAFRQHAENMREVADHLDKIYAIVKGAKINIQADTHMIMIDGPAELMDKLIAAGLADKSPFDEEEGDE